MKRLLHLLRSGRGLRHVPVIQPQVEDVSVRVMLRGLQTGTRDVTDDHVSAALRPMMLGIRLDEADNIAIATAEQLSLEWRDARDGNRLLACVDLKPAGSVGLSRGELRLCEAYRGQNWCAPPWTRWLRYGLSWQHARRAPVWGDRLSMSASDLRCFDVYYIRPRPVYLVSVAYEERSNFFPMDLVGSVSSGEFLLALRATSPAVELIECSGRMAISSAPADQAQAIYRLGAHHNKTTIDFRALPFEVRPSELFGLPVLAGIGSVREVSLRAVHRVGSHVLFVTRIESESGRAGDQLSHISRMYAERLRRNGRPIRALG